MKMKKMKTTTTNELLSPLQTIKIHCYHCSGESYNEVKLCPCNECFLFPYRDGHDPRKAKHTVTEEQRQILLERLTHKKTPTADAEK
jgi:hypothetical protein